ncbi:MAG: hypothetical protein IPP73_15880 [Chitinophagaceae bacterium]|nr:hypothetical protein [Chitinophagaceae bacterium]
MKRVLLLSISLLLVIISYTQNVGIGTDTPVASAALDINSTSKGFLPPPDDSCPAKRNRKSRCGVNDLVYRL